MDKYIKELLELKNSVVLPGVGGLLKVGTSVSINEYLKFNDGKLSAYIAEKENISTDEANQMVESFCSNVNEKLISGNSYQIENLGVIERIDGKISFSLIEVDSNFDDNLSSEKLENAEEIKNEVELPVDENPIEEKGEIKKNILFSDSSLDLSEEDALEAMQNIHSKEELIAFAQNDSRSTVSSYFLEKLASFNEEILHSESENVNDVVEQIAAENPVEDVVESIDEVVEEITTEDLANEVEVDEEKTIPTILKEEKEVIKKDNFLNDPKVEEEGIIETEIEQNVIANPEVTPVEAKEFLEKESVTDVEEETIEKIAIGANKIEKEAKKRKKSKLFLWIGLVLILIGGGILGFLEQDRIKGWLNSNEVATTDGEDHQNVNQESSAKTNESTYEEIKDEPIEEEVSLPEVEPLAEDVVAEEVPADITKEAAEISEEIPEEEITQPISTPSSSSGNYHIIVGSFSNANNATKLVDDLKAEGYNGAAILGKFNGLETVKLGSYQSIDEAKTALQQSGKNGWIKKY